MLMKSLGELMGKSLKKFLGNFFFIGAVFEGPERNSGEILVGNQWEITWKNPYNNSGNNFLGCMPERIPKENSWGVPKNLWSYFL